MAAGGQGFPREARVRHPREFQRISKLGQRVPARAFVMIGMRREPGGVAQITGGRLGLTMSRRVGRAVQRNRIKRLVREWFRQHRSHFPADWDLLVIGRSEASALDGPRLRAELEQQFRRLTQRLAEAGR